MLYISTVSIVAIMMYIIYRFFSIKKKINPIQRREGKKMTCRICGCDVWVSATDQEEIVCSNCY